MEAMTLSELTKNIQGDDLGDWPPPHTIVSIAHIVSGVGPGDVGHGQHLPGHTDVGPQPPHKGLVVLKHFPIFNA